MKMTGLWRCKGRSPDRTNPKRRCHHADVAGHHSPRHNTCPHPCRRESRFRKEVVCLLSCFDSQEIQEKPKASKTGRDVSQATQATGQVCSHKA